MSGVKHFKRFELSLTTSCFRFELLLSRQSVFTISKSQHGPAVRSCSVLQRP